MRAFHYYQLGMLAADMLSDVFGARAAINCNNSIKSCVVSCSSSFHLPNTHPALRPANRGSFGRSTAPAAPALSVSPADALDSRKFLSALR